MKQVLCLIIFVLCVGCQPKKAEVESPERIVYDMYEPSEMALLMNEMYDYNLKIKQDILKGEIPTVFPIHFLEIHKAELSEFKHRNATFESFSKVFIETEKEIFNHESPTDVKERFNNAIGICVSCHQTECTGPIPRIKKLLIQ